MDTSFEMDLIGIAHGGAAIGRHEGRVVFVPYAIPGERVRVEIVESKKGHAHGSAVEILRPSPDRVQPLCPHFGPGGCGGCHFQHIAYQRQLELKREVVVDQLQRVGRFENPAVFPPIPSPSPWGYRSHSTFSVLADGGLGFVSDDNEHVVPIDVCHILHPALVELFSQFEVEPGQLSRIKLQIGSDLADRMLIFQTRDDLAPEIEVDLPISINLLLSDNEPVNLIGSPQVHYQVHHRTMRVTAGAFSQVNAQMMETLVDLVMERLSLQGGESVLDLYSGVGLFTAFMAERASMVTSVESYPPAVTDAEANLGALENVDLIEGPVELVLADLEGPFDAVVVDPPRTGLSVEVLDELARLAVPRLVYVSCDPATFARDAHRLSRSGYRLGDVQPVDMFPQTYHIEAVAALHRQ